MILSTTDVQQLNNWAENNQDVTNQEVSASDFYIAIQNDTQLYIENSTAPYDLPSLTPEALLLLANIAAESTSLTKITLNNINIDGNAAAFVTTLIKSTSLATLSIYNINIGDEAVAFATAISQLPSLTGLFLENNSISDNSVAFANALSKSTSLKTLYMNNSIGDNIVDFAAALSHLKNLTSLDCYNLTRINVRDDVIKQLVDAPKLKVLRSDEEAFEHMGGPFQEECNKDRDADDLVKTAAHNTLNDALLEYLPSEPINGVSWYAGNNEAEIDLSGLPDDSEVE